MAGIVDWDVYVARHRLPLAVLSGGKGEGGPERSVAWADEDSVTMAVAAARRCLKARDRGEIGLLIFATTTHAFAEKSGSSIIAAALGLADAVQTADIGASLRCGAEALVLADDAVRSGRVAQALVVIADCRMGAPGSALERGGGDAAAAFLIGREGVVARLSGQAMQSREIMDTWRRGGDRFVHGWEDRFVAQYGVLEPAVAAASALPKPAEGTTRLWAASMPDKRAAGGFARAVGVGDAVPAPFDTVGYCGAAQAPLLLAGALDRAGAGQEIALVAHGDGAAALLYTVETAKPASTLADAVADRVAIKSQAAYRRARKLDASEYLEADDQGISATLHFRERDADIRLRGQRCACGEPQFPKGRVCIRCGTMDSFTDEDFAERGGTLVTYTLDAFFPAPNPPTCVGVVQVDNGPRIYLQVAELGPDGPELGMALRFAFRRIHEVGKRPNYFWKALPVETRS